GKAQKPVLVEALVAELAVEALDVGVLVGLAWLDELELHAVAVSPLIERSAGELRTLIGPDRPRQSPKVPHLGEDARHIHARNAVIGDDLDRLLGEVVDQRQTLQPPATIERIHHEIHRPDLVRRLRQEQWLTLEHGASALASTLNSKTCSTVEPIDP